MNAIVESGAKKAVENIADRAINAIVDYAKDKYGKKQVKLGNDFKRYLQNAVKRYNKVRTLATGPNPRTIIGEENIYVDIGIKYKEDIISTKNVESIINISKNLIIQGTGGIGKSMLMRYLFLDTAYNGNYVPVLLELRRISNQTEGCISILELIYSCLLDFDVELPKEQFEYSLRLGKYLFLFDGFDEVKEAHAEEAAQAIQTFCSKFPNNPCIITSRPKSQSSPLETFTTVESMTLDKEQAILLASKIWPEDEKAKEFCRQLNSELYDKHKDFAENPLLLSMMFLTFMRNNSIPDHLSDFYQKAYEALYSAHDNNDKGVYKRDFACDSLDEGQFKLILSRFCFITYFKEIYEFSKEEILEFLNDCVKKLNFSEINTSNYLKDLRNAVCLIIQDGDIFRFSHRSFQAYFAAVYTSSVLTDEEQKRLFSKVLSKDLFWNKSDYYKLISQIEYERFMANALEDCLRTIQLKTDSSDESNIFFLKLRTRAIDIFSKDSNGNIRVSYYIASHENYYELNVIDLFLVCAHIDISAKIKEEIINSDIELLQEYYYQISNESEKLKNALFEGSLFYSDIEKYLFDDRKIIYSAINRIHGTENIREAIRRWLMEIDKKRELLNSNNFIDEL